MVNRIKCVLEVMLGEFLKKFKDTENIFDSVGQSRSIIYIF